MDYHHESINISVVEKLIVQDRARRKERAEFEYEEWARRVD